MYLESVVNSTQKDFLSHAFRDLKALSVLLGDNAFFFGATPHALDCTVFAHLTQFLCIPIGFPQESFLNAGIRFNAVAIFSTFPRPF